MDVIGGTSGFMGGHRVIFILRVVFSGLVVLVLLQRRVQSGALGWLGNLVGRRHYMMVGLEES